LNTFLEKLNALSRKNNSLLCVGLDSDTSRLPSCLVLEKNAQLEFNRAIIEATKDIVCAYKPNSAFYEARGKIGWETLEETIGMIPDDIPVILDAKRGDIGNTSSLYAESAFHNLGADAVTVHGYMGRDTIAPFVSREERTVFVLVKTSNPSAAEFEDLELKDGRRNFEAMADLIAQWNEEFPGTLGAVVGATWPEDVAKVRARLPEAPLLVPGVGKQGGDAAATIRNGLDKNGGGLIINASREVIFASDGYDFAKAARAKAMALRDEFNSIR